MEPNNGFRIVFMGTPEFAVPVLARLVEEGLVVGVVTAPDKPAGRGYQLQASAVKQAALEFQLPVLQPEKLRDSLFWEALRSLRADLFVVVAFRMLPEVVWDMPEKGSINLHASLLPAYRGAAPIHWAVVNGEEKTGLTTFFLQHEIDTGALINQMTISIGPEMTTGELYAEMMRLAPEFVLQSVMEIANGTVSPKPQPIVEHAPLAPKLTSENTRIDWRKTAMQVYNHIRGFSPFPCAWTRLNEQVFKIYLAQHPQKNEPLSANFPTDLAIGELYFDGKQLWVQTREGVLVLLDVQLAGRKRMPAEAFARGVWQLQMRFDDSTL
jgi:methionyl-tRNA formyltransferase